jgi:DNA polymerase-3 subunit beta
MSFTVSSTQLLKHINAIAGVIPAKSVLPIIQNIHFELDDTQLRLTGTDLEVTLRTALYVEAESDFALNLALPNKLLTDILKALPEQPVEFAPQEGNVVILKTDNGEYRINGLNGEDFPRMPQPDDTVSISLPLDVLQRAIEKTLFAASTDDLKPAMNGVFFDLKPEHITFVATDAHRLVRYRRLDVQSAEAVNFIVALKALKLVNSASSNSDEDSVRIEYNKTNVFFTFGNTLMVSRLIDARFPEYENVIPSTSANKLVINKKELLGTMKRLDIFSNKTTHLGRFQLAGNVLSVDAQDSDYANEAKEQLQCLYEGEEMEIGFNLAQMIEIINSIETEDVILEMGGPGRAAVALPSMQADDENLLMLLMPIMLSSGY